MSCACSAATLRSARSTDRVEAEFRTAELDLVHWSPHVTADFALLLAPA